LSFASNGDGFYFFMTKTNPAQLETEISLEDFPTPQQLLAKFLVHGKGFTKPEHLRTITLSTITTMATGKAPHAYYHLQAI